MKRTALAACVATAAWAGLAVAPAWADTQQLYASGLWSAYGGTTGDDKQVCGITTVGPDGRRIAIQQFADETGLDFQLVKSSWAIPDNTPIDLSIQFDNSPVTPAKAVGSGSRVVLQLPFEQTVPFMQALRAGTQLHVYFPGGNEPAWTGGLSGTSNVINAFNTCRDHLAPAAPTQPFQPQAAPPSPPPAAPAPAAPTQPFSGQTPPPPSAPAPPPATPPT